MKKIISRLVLGLALSGTVYASENKEIFSYELEDMNPEMIKNLVKLSHLEKKNDREKFIEAVVHLGSRITVDDIQKLENLDDLNEKSALVEIIKAFDKSEVKKDDLISAFGRVNYDPDRDKFKGWGNAMSNYLDEGNFKSQLKHWGNIDGFVPIDAWHYFVAQGVIQLALGDSEGHMNLFKGLWKQQNKSVDMIVEAGIHLEKWAQNPDVLYPYWEKGMFAQDLMMVFLEGAKSQDMDVDQAKEFIQKAINQYLKIIQDDLLNFATKETSKNLESNEIFKKNLQQKFNCSIKNSSDFMEFYIKYLYNFCSTMDNHLKFGKYNIYHKSRSEKNMIEDMEKGLKLVASIFNRLNKEFENDIDILEIIKNENFMDIVKTNRQIIEMDESEGSAYLWRTEFSFDNGDGEKKVNAFDSFKKN